MAENINIPYILQQANNTFKKRNVLYPINILEAIVYTKSRGELDSEKDKETIRKIATKTMLKFVKDNGKKGMDNYACRHGTKYTLYITKTNDFVQDAWDFYEATVVSADESGGVRVKDRRRGSVSKNVGNFLHGQPLSKTYQKRLKRNKSGYADFVRNIAFELYCEAEGIENVDKFKEGELSQTQIIDLFVIKGVAADFARENKARFRKYLTQNKEIFNQNGEDEIQKEAEEYFGEKLFDEIEKVRKRHGIKERIRKITIDAKVLAEETDSIGETITPEEDIRDEYVTRDVEPEDIPE